MVQKYLPNTSSKFNELWLVVLGLLIFFIFIETFLITFNLLICEEYKYKQLLNQKRSYNRSETTVVKNSAFNFKTKLHRAELELIKVLIHSDFDKRKNLEMILMTF